MGQRRKVDPSGCSPCDRGDFPYFHAEKAQKAQSPGKAQNELGCITKTEGFTPPFRLNKKLRRIFRVSEKQSQNHFASGRVPDAKYISGCKCGICSQKANGVPIKRNALYGGRRYPGTGEISRLREMEQCVWCIDDMHAADCKKLSEKAKGLFRQFFAAVNYLTTS